MEPAQRVLPAQYSADRSSYADPTIPIPHITLAATAVRRSGTAMQAHHAFALVRRRAETAGADGDGGAIPRAFCCSRILPMRSPLEEPTCRPTSFPLR